MTTEPLLTQLDAPAAESKPFLIEHLRLNEAPTGFTPAARVVVTPELRISGLLQALTDEAAKSLLLLLTFLTPNGNIQPTVLEVAEALAISERQAQQRLLRLAGIFWRGEPIVQTLERENGMDAFALAPGLVENRSAPESPMHETILPIPSSREAVIAQSRTQYARPRAEVEEIIASQLGYAAEDFSDSIVGKARRVLRAYGVPRETVDALLSEHAPEEVLQQAAWLPYHRQVKSPGHFLVAAVRGRYGPPGQLAEKLPVVSPNDGKQSDGDHELDGGV